MKKWILPVVLAAVAYGGYAWGWPQWKTWQAANRDAHLPKRPTTAVVETRDIQFAVTAAGEIGPAEQVSVRPEVNGKIDNLAVDIGDAVKTGDLLFTLDDRDLQIERESKDKEIERARLELGQAERNYRRSKELFDANLISEELFEETRTLFELSRNALGRSEKALELVTDRLRKTRISAPFDCTVLTRPVSVGQAVSGSGGFNSGTEVLTIANLNEMVINAHVNQADVTRLKTEQEVHVSVEAVPGLMVTGRVERVAPQATIRNNIKGFAARILLKNVDPRIRPGMTANIQIPVASADNVVAVPLAAIFTERNPTTQQTERFVFVTKGDQFERRSVEIGVSDYFFAEVQSGLSAGEVVALELPKDELDKLAKASLAAGGGGPGRGPLPPPQPAKAATTNAPAAKTPAASTSNKATGS